MNFKTNWTWELRWDYYKLVVRKFYLWKYSKIVEGEKIEIRESRIMDQPRDLEFIVKSFQPPNDRLMVPEDLYSLDHNAFKELTEVVITFLLALDFYNQF